MQPKEVQRILGILLMLFSTAMLPPIGVGVWFGDGAVWAFVSAMALTLVTGLAIWFPVRRRRRDLRLRDGFLIVILFWTVLGIFGGLPFVFAEHPHMKMVDAMFESFSGLTTTGATVIVGIDRLPHAILFYRQLLQWLGGMGIIVLAVAVLPMLGVGGMQLYRAETPGPVKDTKLKPRIAETAKALWYIYLGLTITCALTYWLAGMSLFDAIGHSFSTVAIGGFSTHDASIGYFRSPVIEAVAVIFMILSALNFGLHFVAWRSFSLRPYFRDPEARAFLTVTGFVASITVLYLYFSGIYSQFAAAVHHGIFQAVSIGTTTGFTTAEYYFWPGFLPILLLLTSFIGGCAGSTGGGMKVIRVLLLLKQGGREIVRLIHPSAEIPVKVGRKVMEDSVMDAVWGFFSLYVVSFCVMSIALTATGLDIVTAFSAVAACINNLGPGLGEVGLNYKDVNAAAKWILCFAMLLGRLEVFTLLVLLTPRFWRS